MNSFEKMLKNVEENRKERNKKLNLNFQELTDEEKEKRAKEKHKKTMEKFGLK